MPTGHPNLEGYAHERRELVERLIAIDCEARLGRISETGGEDERRRVRDQLAMLEQQIELQKQHL